MPHGPEPGTILNETGEPTEPRQAATVVVLRGGAERLEVLLAQRTPKARFMGGAWVFPGGAVDAHEARAPAPRRCARSRRRSGSRCPTRTRSCPSRAGSRRPR